MTRWHSNPHSNPFDGATHGDPLAKQVLVALGSGTGISTGSRFTS